MDVLHADDLTQLTADRGRDRLSLFMSTHRGRSDVHGNRARFNDLLQRAKQALRADGAPTARVNAVLDDAHELFDDVCLWERPRTGLALFTSPARTRCFWLPLPLPDLVTIGARFTIGPLLPMLVCNRRFFVLALSQDDVQLFEGTRFRLNRVALDESPLTLLQTMPQPKRTPVNAFPTDRGRLDRATAVFHGGDEEDHKKLIVQHFRRIDRALRDALGDEQAPLVLAGVGYLQGLYRKASTHPRVLARGITGNPRDIPRDLMYRQAWQLVQPELRAHETDALERYRALRGTGCTTGDPREVLTAAEQGRIATLFASTKTSGREHTSLSTEAVLLNDPPDPAEYPDLAAAATLRHAGSLQLVPAHQMPEDTPVAAILRY